MSSIEFSEHMAMAQLEPALYFPEYTAGTICATIANSFAKKKGSKGFSVQDFFSLDHEPKDMEADQIKSVLSQVTEAAAARQRGAVMRRPKD